MKIVTVTFHRARNYGAVLQTYALHKVLLDLGYENQIIDDENESLFYISKKSFRLLLATSLLSLNNLLKYQKMKKQADVFQAFVSNHIELTKEYKSDTLLASPPQADIYLSGSDQVFSFSIEPSKIYRRFLQFGNEEVIRVSYAASFGEFDLTNDKQVEFAKYLKEFDKISIRERVGAQYIHTFSNTSTNVHIDPVFLRTKEQWEDIIVEPKINEDYILVFPISNHVLLQKIVNQLKEETKLRVICIQTRSVNIIKADQVIIDASPEEYLGYIKKAKHVITTSFHGTAFSILFHKDFYTLIKAYRPQRMENLFELFQLDQNRLIKDEITFTKKPLDCNQIDSIIDNERKRSILYLQSFKDIRK